MTSILGISAYYHDAAAALIVDGEMVAAAQQERFSRLKHDASFPTQAVQHCLQQANLDASDLDYVAFYEKPLAKFERLLETYLAVTPAGYRSFRTAIPQWLRQKLHLQREIRTGLQHQYKKRIGFVRHHVSHASSAFYPSPFEEAAILTIDGVGEWDTACYGTGRGNRIELQQALRFPHSLGLLYSAFTFFTGFEVNGGEYKLMGLAPYGQPHYYDRILKHLIDLKPDGSFRMDMQYFHYCRGLTMTNKRFASLFDGPPRNPNSEITQREKDLASSIQKVTEEVVLRMAAHVQNQTQMSNLVLAGGVALNSVANGRLVREGPFDNVWIQPAAGDSGGALGSAMYVWHQLLEKPRTVAIPDGQHGSLLGPGFTEQEIENCLQADQVEYDVCDNEQDLCRRVARLIDTGKVVGWFQGRMEFGPRALGNRSILADARSPDMQARLNKKTKSRESFRPFAPIVLQEKAADYFDLSEMQDSPYMLLVTSVRQNHASLPAITHVDGSARIQTVTQDSNPRLHRLLTCFEAITGTPVLVNTSFNVRDEPIVCSPADALRCFQRTDIDVLAIGNCIVQKVGDRCKP
ncbi:Decarbamoylnovobiocin carbamoyltransferase [Roseimaritima multifibrata]|uniref:Decarbamoylnovobiocin carbamoyltransferase n=1 Tax=Roseimaritima multifibrata TaxID=1930274 RepID=A0A517MEM4_9BACT|nr:carbamoyltransferase [Roseimaritima multifibrata]QDS93340.1 Decarbamoylnovobiocin carbamoyltransferase [Roseimaritima multifibrata]